jgi:hypothetical protein
MLVDVGDGKAAAAPAGCSPDMAGGRERTAGGRDGGSRLLPERMRSAAGEAARRVGTDRVWRGLADVVAAERACCAVPSWRREDRGPQLRLAAVGCRADLDAR